MAYNPNYPAAEEEGFWMIWSPEGKQPTVGHKTEERAIEEASRLAREHPGRKFYILLAVQLVEAVSVKRTRLELPVPF